jgi:hypothetical protein
MTPTLKLTFCARCWGTLFPVVVRLIIVQCQVDRGKGCHLPVHPSLTFLLDFVMTLNKYRIGQPDTTTVDFFKSLQCPIDATFLPHIDPIYLFPTRKKVHQLNIQCLNALPDVLWIFTVIDDYSRDTNKKLFHNSLVEAKICLKTDMQVMLL